MKDIWSDMFSTKHFVFQLKERNRAEPKNWIKNSVAIEILKKSPEDQEVRETYSAPIMKEVKFK